MDPGVLFNAMRRSVRWPGIAGGRMRSGTISARDRAGMGDCILMDFRKGFFAVSDSSSRYPPASRNFLLKFAQGLEDLSSFDAARTFSQEAFDRIGRSILERSEGLLQTIPFTESCTFTGILVMSTEAGKKGILFHTGDSLLFEVNPVTSEAKEMTTSNFWMVGRSKRFFQVEEMEIPPEAVFILATDGVRDLQSQDRGDRSESLVRVASQVPVEEIPDRVVETIDRRQVPTDDIVVVSLHPDRLRFFDARILLGGTVEGEETHIREERNAGLHEDRYLPIKTLASRKGSVLPVTVR
jgi:Stage II sporulation protein E (SpoIIE)